MPPATRKTDVCISKDTVIPLLDGRNIPISELNIDENIYTYSLDLKTKEIVPGKIRKVFKTGTFECLRIWFDNGQYLDCTEDHEIINKSGSYVPANKLKINDSLMHLYGTNNHKITKIEKIGMTETWDLTVDVYHNFAILSGVFIRNCTGHGCYPSRPSCSGSGDTFTNNLAQMRLTDCYEPHGCCCCPAHGGMLACGSGTVNVNNLPAGRQGDCVDCGSFADQHSGDVNIGG